MSILSEWGRVTSIANSQEDFRLYFLVGQPQDNKLIDAYNSAISILQKTSIESKVFQESNADELSKVIENEVEKHERRLH